MQKYFRLFFGSIETFKICFQDLLTFKRVAKKLVASKAKSDTFDGPGCTGLVWPIW